MVKRDLRPLKEFCYAHEREELWAFVESYLFRDLAALYHISNIRDKLETVKQPPDIQTVLKVEQELSFEVDALILTLNSMFDLMLQIINEAFLTPTETVRCKDWKELKKRPSFPSNVVQYIDQARGHATYQKVKDYSNISKHIRAIQGRLTIDFRPDTPQTDYTTGEFGFKQCTALNVDDLEKCREFTKETLEGLITLVESTLRCTP